MIGNDIIDLHLVKSQNKFRNQRYLEKVFCHEEQELIKSSQDPDLVLWTLWSMKEAAYKAHQRSENLSRKINPISFKCLYDLTEEKVEVHVDNSIYLLSIDLTADYIHCYSDSDHLYKRIYTTEKVSPEQFVTDLENISGFGGKKFSYSKNENGVPSLVCKKTFEKVPVSLSHHGKFTAFVIPLINS